MVLELSRRIAMAGAVGLVAGVRGKGKAMPGRDRISADLDRYIAFGNKASGGAGDTATGEWLEAELRRAGAETVRQSFDTPFFSPKRAEVIAGEARVPVLPLAIVVPTGPTGVRGRLVRVEPGMPLPTMQGAIAWIELPYARWSSALVKPIAETVRAATAAGAIAALLITNGPTGKAIALNADGRTPLVDRPVAILAPEKAGPLRALLGAPIEVTLVLDGEGGRRPAFNLAARWDRRKGSHVVVSTPRSGWTACAGERGPGIATWLSLARWAPAALAAHNLLFLCNSGHEYENLGSEHALQALAPPPEETALWLHLGANLAARDWHEAGAGTLLPLPSADPQRFLVVSPALLPLARRCFQGLAGLEVPYPAQTGSAGELSTILAAGYQRVAGIFGAHRFHHVAEDDARCVDAGLVSPVRDACQQMLRQAVA